MILNTAFRIITNSLRCFLIDHEAHILLNLLSPRVKNINSAFDLPFDELFVLIYQILPIFVASVLEMVDFASYLIDAVLNLLIKL